MTLQPVSQEAPYRARLLDSEVCPPFVAVVDDRNDRPICHCMSMFAAEEIAEALSRSLPVDEALVERLQAAVWQVEMMGEQYEESRRFLRTWEEWLPKLLAALTKPASIGDVERLYRALVKVEHPLEQGDDVSPQYAQTLRSYAAKLAEALASLSPVVGEEG